MTADTTRGAHPIPAAHAAGADAKAQALRADALAPLQLLRQLDGWLDNTGHDDEHPWRVCIGATLATHGVDAPTVPAINAGHLFWEIAQKASVLRELLEEVLNGNTELWAAAFSSVAHLGWMADSASVAHGEDAFRGDAAAWFLSPRAASAMEAAERATRSQGGAA